jgi:hypothetical protein
MDALSFYCFCGTALSSRTGQSHIIEVALPAKLFEIWGGGVAAGLTSVVRWLRNAHVAKHFARREAHSEIALVLLAMVD